MVRAGISPITANEPSHNPKAVSVTSVTQRLVEIRSIRTATFRGPARANGSKFGLRRLCRPPMRPASRRELSRALPGERRRTGSLGQDMAGRDTGIAPGSSGLSTALYPPGPY